MSDIQPGDWVTASSKRPYKVLEADTASAWVYVQTPHGVGMLLSDWCVKEPTPWKPKSLTLWTDRRHEGVWQVLSDGRVRLLDSMDVVLDAEYVQRTYGPMTQLVPKKAALVEEPESR